MIIKSIDIEKFRAIENASITLGKRITAISGRNATQKTTVLGMIGQPFSISKGHPMYGCKTIDGYNFRSQFKDKFKISKDHDIIGEHKWKLNFHNGICDLESYAVESIPRTQKGHETSLRFWNATSHSKGAGYVQLPVYYLSLSRIFPIGEAGKTKSIPAELNDDEATYCINHYREILSIQEMCGKTSVGLEKAAASKTFAGVSDDIHDIFTNSAGEGNILRILLAVLSFKRLKEQYGKTYKGGILLIDEIDATLYGFSQIKLVDYLWHAAKEYKIQIIFTTHSPIILKCVNKYQREEREREGVRRPLEAYGASIVYLEPDYKDNGKRIVVPRNITTSSEVNEVLDDINLSITMVTNKVRVYCEDKQAANFIQYLISYKLGINCDLYMSLVDVNLGWTNYLQLVGKKIPEFNSNMIVLDGDVQYKDEFNASKQNLVTESGNVIFLPLVIEKGIFELLKNHEVYKRFQNDFSPVHRFTYDMCFNDWPLETESYKTNDYKKWFSYVVKNLGNPEILYKFWCDEHQVESDRFVEQFVKVFNSLAKKNEVDTIPTS